MESEVLILGGGLSGLSLASRLHTAGRDVRVLEARDRTGGRILSLDGFDLGPAWFWAGQHRIAALVDRLGLRRFEQFATGALTFEAENGDVERGLGFASMEGSWRLEGGLGRLTDALARELPADRLHLSQTVRTLTRTPRGITAETASGDSFHAARVVLAMPPRLAGRLTYSPALSAETIRAMEAVPTWMAGQAKAVAIYDRPFWRDAGLSGDAMSRRGPMVEVHDASPAAGGGGALFGFIGVPPAARGDAERLERAVLDQFARLFGDEAARPTTLHLKDWAIDPLTSTGSDRQPLYAHPHYGTPSALTGLWDGRMILSGSETAARFGGYLEGALEAAEITLALLEPERV